MRNLQNILMHNQEIFKKITSPLKKLFNFSFGYMKVFRDGRYIAIDDNIDCLNDFIQNVSSSGIFCKQNITCSHDGDFVFTLWPDLPINPAMEIYFRHNVSNGITISKSSVGYVELWWFTAGKDDQNASEFFIRNKAVLLQYVKYFNLHKPYISLLDETKDYGMFKFQDGFDSSIMAPHYNDEFPIIRAFKEELKSNILLFNMRGGEVKLSSKDFDILYAINHGCTAKAIAQKSNLSIKTIQHRIERIKLKLGLHYRMELMEFYEDNVKSVIE